jgi:dynamin 1-like protein
MSPCGFVLSILDPSHVVTVLQPVSTEPGMISLDDNDDGESTTSTTTDNINGINGSGGRSVSNTIHDRARLANSSSAPPVGGAHVNGGGRQSFPVRSTGGRSSHNRPSSQSSSGSSPNTAKETFLNYFFGQNGPGPMAAGASLVGDHHHRAVNGGGYVGRDVSGPEIAANGLLAPRRSMDGSDAAFDMKSLGRHIEAVSLSFQSTPPSS